MTGLEGAHSALDPAGIQAARIAALARLLFWTAGIVYVAVVIALARALWHRRGPAAGATLASPDEPHGALLAVSSAVIVTAVVVTALVATSFFTGRSLASLGGRNPLTIRLTGHQWWWEVEYSDATPSRSVRTANEIHVPVGVPVRIHGTSVDVIHGFWVPSLHGKIDLIPGRQTQIWLQADRPGVYRGQCAEFCGYQHAHMAFVVVAEPRERFDAWLDAERAPAAEPADDEQRLGRDVFLNGTCAMCHTIRGTPAASRVGPELTHVGRRTTLAAGTLPNQRGHLAGWIVDPQGIKPGVRMPQNRLAPDELQALLAYLEHLG